MPKTSLPEAVVVSDCRALAGEDFQADAAFGEVVEDVDQVAQVAAEPVELPHHEGVAGSQRLIGLARVSTNSQDLQLQRDALEAAGCIRIFEEMVSSRSTRRPGLEQALESLRDGTDPLVVWKLDRLGRSTKQILTIADDLSDRGIGLRVLSGTLGGTYTPTGEGKFFFTVMAAFAELERDLNRERTMAGLAAAREQGRVGGRPPVMDADKIAAARARRAAGETPTQIAKALGVSRETVYRHLAG